MKSGCIEKREREERGNDVADLKVELVLRMKYKLHNLWCSGRCDGKEWRDDWGPIIEDEQRKARKGQRAVEGLGRDNYDDDGENNLEESKSEGWWKRELQEVTRVNKVTEGVRICRRHGRRRKSVEQEPEVGDGYIGKGVEQEVEVL